MNARPAPGDIASLRPLFEPRSVAVIGASADPTRIGGRPISGSLLLNYRGQLYPVNPARTEVQGLPCYPSLASIGAAIDLAVIALPAARCAEALGQCARQGVKAAIVLSAGFGEQGGDGVALQDRLAASAREAGIRLVGPNCMGILNLRAGLVASFTSLVDADPERIGAISVISQSGAFGSHCLALMRERGLGLDLWATTGNQADVEFADCLAYFAQSPQTRVIVGCVEGIADGGRLLAALGIARARHIPVVMMKLGRSDVGRQAAATHTAALAGSDAVFDAVLEEFAVHRARTVDELFDVAYACTAGKFPRSADVGLITTSGGFGIVMADAAADCGLAVPPLPDATQARLKSLVPFAGTRNPLDVTGQFINDPSAVLPMFEALIADGGFPATICYVGSAGVVPRLMDSLAGSFETVAQRHPEHLLVLSMIAHAEVRKRYESLGYLVYEDATRAVAAVAALHRLALRFTPQHDDAYGTTLPTLDAPARAGSTLDEAASKRLLAAAGIAFLPERIAASAHDAIIAAHALGFPVAMKILSADIPHKSDIGGVALGVADESAAATAYAKLIAAAHAAAPAAHIEGVLVAPMLTDGVEIIVGCHDDPVFGPVVMVGLGGVFVESFAAPRIRRAPFGLVAARALIAGIPGVATLRGARGRAPADIEALANVLVTLSRFAAANAPWLQSVDLNPVVVRGQGKGAVALDALVAVKP